MSQRYSCDCRCGKDGFRNRMSVVEAIQHQVSDAAHVQKPVHRFLVLKDCEGAFKRELEMQDALRVLITRGEERAITFNFGRRRFVWRCFLFRWPLVFAVHAAQVAIHRRNLGLWEARKSSLKMLSLFLSPDWLAFKFERFWRRRR